MISVWLSHWAWCAAAAQSCLVQPHEHHYTAISSPKQSDRPSTLSTFKSRAALSAPATSPCPKLSRSSLSSVLDSYSDPIPDSLKRSSSKAPRTCSPRSELSSVAPSLGVSPVSWPCSWPSSPREEKRKHSSRTPLLLSPRGLVLAPMVPGEQGPERAETQALSVIWSWDWAANGPVDEEGVRGSRSALGGLARKVISRRLSWEPTEHKSKKAEETDQNRSQQERILAVPCQHRCKACKKRIQSRAWGDYVEWDEVWADRIWSFITLWQHFATG